MITGYRVGTEVKWNEQETLTTGIVEQVFHEPGEVVMNGSTVKVEADGDNPVYLIRHHTGDHLLLPHTDVFLKDMNRHT